MAVTADPYIALFDSVRFLALASGPDPWITVALHGGAAGDALIGWAAAHGLDLQRDTIRPAGYCPWTRLCVSLGVASAIEVHVGAPEPGYSMGTQRGSTRPTS
jgi:hypothetical protein